jgi:ribose transport system substrate-binding protein
MKPTLHFRMGTTRLDRITMLTWVCHHILRQSPGGVQRDTRRGDMNFAWLVILFGWWPSLAGCAKTENTMEIVVIPKGLTHEHWQSVHRGALRAAADLWAEKRLAVRIIWDGPLRERDALAQIRIVDRRISTRVAGIVLAPQHSQTMCPPVERARREGIPVVVIDSGLERPDLFAKYVATDNFRGGYLAGDHLLKVLARENRPTRRVVMLRYAVGSESTEQREAGFVKRMREEEANPTPGLPPLEFIDSGKYAGATRDSARREAGPLLQQYTRSDGTSSIDGLFAPNESSASGVLDVLKSLGQNRQVHLVGFDSSQPLLQAVEAGDVDGLILQDPYRMGYLGVWAVVHAALGYDVQSQEFLSTGEYVITRENVNSEATRGLYNPEAQARRPSTELRRSPVTGQEIRWESLR